MINKILAVLVLITFSTNQLVWAGGNEILLQNPSPSLPSTPASEAGQAPASPAEEVIPQAADQFLQGTNPLSGIVDAVNLNSEEQSFLPSVNDPAEKMPAEMTEQNYEYERYAFEDALDLLRPEYASAVILQSLKPEDLRALTGLSFETGIAVIEGEIVLFTSGDRGEIRMLEPARRLLEKADFISHVHVDAGAQNGPSQFDIDFAAGTGATSSRERDESNGFRPEEPDEEYVITRNGVYGYNRSGVQNGGRAYSYQEYLARLEAAIEQSAKPEIASAASRPRNDVAGDNDGTEAPTRNDAAASRADNDDARQVEARAHLNEFIAAMDRANEAGAARETFRASDIILEAEAMQTEGGTWNGGSYQSLWGNGLLKKTHPIQQAGLYEIEIIASGNDNGQPAPPELKIMVDGVMVSASLQIPSSHWNYKSYRISGIELGSGAHEISAGIYAAGAGQSISIDKILLRKTGETQYESTRQKIAAAGMQSTGGTWNGGSYVSLWGDGALHQTLQVSESGVYQIEVMALANENGQPQRPEMKILVNGAMAGESLSISTNNWNYKSYKVSLELTAGAHQLELGGYAWFPGQSLSIKEVVLKKTGEIVYEAARRSAEAVSMQASGGTWNGGAYMTLWGDGELHQIQNIQESGVYEIEVIAVGGDGGITPPPSLKVMAGGVMIGNELTISNTNWNYKSYKTTAKVELAAGSHDLGLGVYSKLDGQFLGVKRIVLRKVGEIAYPSAARTFQAASMQASGGTWNGGNYMTLWGDGELHQIQNIQESGVYEIEVVAVGGDGGTTPPPSLKVMADGVMIGNEVTVANSQWNYRGRKTARFELSAGSHDLSLGVYSSLPNQFLGVKEIILRKVGEIAFESAKKTAEALSMQASGGTWNGGTYMTLWGDGELHQIQNIQESGVYEIEVIAIGSDGGITPPPSLKIMTGGAMIGNEVTITNSNWNYKSYKTTAKVELAAGSHDIGLGVYSKLEGQFLGVKGIVLRKVDEIAYEAAKKSTNAVNMQASGGTWNGGNYMTLWGNGELRQTHTLQESGIYEIEVIAVGGDGGTAPAPSLKVMADGVMIGGEVSVTNNHWNYRGHKTARVELAAGAHDFSLGVYSKLDNQFLGVKGIVLRKVGEIPYESARKTANATSMQASGGTWNGGNYMTLWGNGELHQIQNIQEAGIYEVEVIAMGSETGTRELPEIKVLVNGAIQGGPVEIANNRWNYQGRRVSGIALDAGNHDFGLGLYSAFPDQWVGIKGIVLRKIGGLPFPSEVTSANAQTLQASGDHWNGGSYVSIWGNGRLQLPQSIHEPGIYEIEIEASGAPNGQTPDPSLMVFVDGIVQGDAAAISNNLWNYKSYKISGIRIGEGTHSLSAGIATALPGQWIGIQKITARKIAELPEAALSNLPAGDEIIFNADGSTSAYRYADHSEIRYLQNAANPILITGAAGNPVETIDRPAATPLSDMALSFQLENGITAFYEEEELVEFRTADGVRITDFILNAFNEIQNALITYPDGTREIVRNGAVVRKIFADGTVQDFRPDGVLVREITSEAVQYFTPSRVFTLGGAFAAYDEYGLLRETRDPAGKHFVFTREETPDSFILSLDRFASSVPGPESMVKAVYARSGNLKKAVLQNRRQIDFENGKIMRITDAQGGQVNYSYEEAQSLLKGLQVTRGGSEFNYNASGFLESVTTASGVIRRIQNGNEIELLLESAGGSKLSDFELDSEGRILRGIIETKEGIKQTIENGILTGFETADGKIYEMRDVTGGREAVLKEWKLRDGTRVVYGGGTVSEIVFSDGKRLHTIGFNANKQVETVTEQLPDGTEKFYQKGQLVKLITSTLAEIFYDFHGYAEKIILPDASEEKVSYKRDADGVIQEVIFTGEHTNRIFKADGTLLRLLMDGVSAEITDNEVSRLFTRFGEIANPQFDAQGVLAGEILFLDGAKQIIENGKLIQTILASGAKVNYANGRISSIEAGATLYEILYIEVGGAVKEIKIRTGGQEYSLVTYLLDRQDSELAKILLPRPLHDSFSDRLKIKSEVNTGDSLFFAKIAPDANRGNVYEFQNPFSPEWNNVSQGTSQGYVSFTNSSSLYSELIDLNGDRLVDRVYMESTSANYWWVQMNTGFGFASPVQWTGVEASSSSAMVRQSEYGRTYGYSDLMDINGDGKPDRILEKMGSEQEWYVQINTGTGFNTPVKWQGSVQLLPQVNTVANYALHVRNDQGNKDIQELVSDFIDLDGDGLPDRVMRPTAGPMSVWLFQKNLGNGFADAVLWEGVDSSFNSDATLGAALSTYITANNNKRHPYDEWVDLAYQMWEEGLSQINDSQDWALNMMGQAAQMFTAALVRNGFPAYNGWGFAAKDALRKAINDVTADTADLADMNGDGLLDRVILKQRSDVFDWYVQLNNGDGFDTPILWDNSVRAMSESPNKQVATSIRVMTSATTNRNVLVDLVDVTGDGLPDRVTLDRNPSQGSIWFNSSWSEPDTSAPEAISSWWVEVNTGSTFAPAVQWTGIYGNNGNETSITQDTENFKAYSLGLTSASARNIAALEDINGDKIADRVIYRPGESKWYVQFGTGTGFLPVQSLELDSLAAATNQISSSRYDSLHVSLKSASNIPQSTGVIKVMLGDPSDTQNYQEWTVSDLSTSWKDLYLPLDKNKGNANQVKIKFIPTGADPHIPIYVDNMTFTAVRPPDSKDWLDRLLSEENVLAEVYSDRTQTLAQYLGFSQAADATAFNWDQLLRAETKIAFDTTGEAKEFQTLYGSVSKIENGRVVETVMPDGSKIQFGQINETSQTTTQTITKSDGTIETMQLSYGRVRSVARPGKSSLEYSYEFDAAGREITIVRDSDTGIVERYLENRLISRTQASGVVTSFEYDLEGKLKTSILSYKGRVHHTFSYKTGVTGARIVETEEGVIEEYSPEGQILFHTTPEGYRYAHTFERAKKAVTILETETVTFPDGSTFTVDVPTVTLQDDPEGEQVHRVSLINYKALSGENANYEEGVLKSIVLPDQTRISFNRFEVVENFNDETGETTREVRLLDAVIFYADGTVTEFKDGKPFSVTSATGRVISLATDHGYLINPDESAAFHKSQAEKLWNNFAIVKWNAFQAPGTLPVQIEYALDGKLVTRQFAEGIIELYDQGRIQEVVAPDGEKLIQYSYDQEGNPTRIELGAARRRLQASVLKLKAEIALERERALAHVAEREQVLNQTIEGQYIVARDQLLAIRAQIEAEANNLANIKVKGKKAKNIISDVWLTIQAGLDQVNGALEQLARNRAEALKQLSDQVRQVSEQIETQTTDAYTQLETENANSKRAILRQEISPVVYHWYRKILGRDPSQAEYDAVINSANYAQGTFDLEGLKANLSNPEGELGQRTMQVQAIKTSVQVQLLQYLTLSQPDKLAFAQSLGITSVELVEISTSEANAVLDWLLSRSLHFGQSAYLALEALLADAGISFDRVELASRLILMDILTGVLTPLEQGDLVISVYAIRRTADYYGLDTHALKLTYDALKAMYDDACASDPQTCDFRLIGHINGDHFIIITKVTDTEVTYIDPGAGPEQALDQVILAKEEFLKAWIDPTNPNDGFGYVISPRAPPAGLGQTQVKILTASEEMSVRGAFFPFLIPIFMAIINAIVQAVTVIINVVVQLVTGLVNAISSIFQGIGGFFSNIASGNWSAAFGSVFKGFTGSFNALHGALLTGIQGIAGSIPFIGPALSSLTATSAFAGALKLGLIGFTLQGAGKLLETIGLSPKITQTIISGGKIIAGVALLATGNPAGIAVSFGLLGSGTSEILSLHTNLPPTLTSIISIGAIGLGAFAGGLIDTSTLAGALAGFKAALPYISMDLASAGVVGLGNALGLDPRLTSLISIPISAAIGVGVDSLLHATRINSTSLLAAIKNGLAAGGKSLGLTTGGSLLGSITSNSLLSSISSNILGEDIFNKFFNFAKTIVLSPFKLLDSAVSGIRSFGSLIQEKGLAAAFKSVASSIFGQQSIEAVLRAGGFDTVLGQSAQTIILPTGQQVQELRIDNGLASIFFGQNGEVAGIREGSTYRLGQFGIDALGKFGMVAGKIITTLLGHPFEAKVLDGAITNFKGTINGVLVEGEGQNGGIFIPGPGPEPGIGQTLGNLFSGLIKVAGGIMAFAFESGLLTNIFSLPEAEASTTIAIPLPDMGNVLLKALENAKSISSSLANELKERFKWLVHYTSVGGLNGIMGDGEIDTNAEGEAFMSKEIPTPFSFSENIYEGERSEIAMRLQIPSSNGTYIDSGKTTHFIVIDSEDIESRATQRDVAILTSALDVNGQIQSPGFTGAKEYVFHEAIPLAGRLIWPPFASPGLMLGFNATRQSIIDPGFNSLQNWAKAGAAIIRYFLKKWQI